jgi:hypothetical protein
MEHQNHVETEIEETEKWWRKDEIRDADMAAALSLNQFTPEFVGLLVKAVQEDPQLREKIDILCDYKLYNKFFRLKQFTVLFRGIRLNVPKSLEADFDRLYSKVFNSRLDASEKEDFSRGCIARELRNALGYNEFEPEDMCDERTRELVEDELRFSPI